jgi:hypothetical protein
LFLCVDIALGCCWPRVFQFSGGKMFVLLSLLLACSACFDMKEDTAGDSAKEDTSSK